MKADLKRKWIKALRSGKYEQGRERLRSPHGFCCLGVLCDIVDPSKWSERKLQGFSYLGRIATLPPELFSAQDLTASSQLIVMNDSGKSFAEIADYIEANIPAEENSVADASA